MQEKKYQGVDDTVNYAIAIIKKHSGDDILKYFDNKKLSEIFDFISKDVRYLTDPMKVKYLDGGSIELLRSPEKTMYELAGDCDDKAILAGSLFQRYNIPYRMAVISNKENKKFHHIFPEVKLNNKWKTFDATYEWNKMFENKPFTKKEVFYPGDKKIIKEEIK